MKSDEFVKNIYLEKLTLLKEYQNKVDVAGYDWETGAKFMNICSDLITDAMYSLLLGIDGASSLGNTQQTYKIYDESGSLISECGELEASAYEYFYEYKYELENTDADICAILNYKQTSEGGRATPAKSGYRPHIKFEFDINETSATQLFLGRFAVFPGETVTAVIKLLTPELFYKKLKCGENFELKEGTKTIANGKITKIINEKLLI